MALPSEGPGLKAAVQEAHGFTIKKVLAGLGLAVVVAGLTGCNSNIPILNGGQTTTSQATTQDPTLDNTRSTDRATFMKLSENTFYESTLQRMSTEMGTTAARPDAKPQPLFDTVKIALTEGQKLKAKPDQQHDLYVQALKLVADNKGEDPASIQYAEVATGALQVGSTAFKDADSSIDYIAQVKTAAYEPALQKIVTMPEDVAAKTGVQTEQTNAYLNSLADQAKNALDAGAKIKDPRAQAALYETTLKMLGNRLKEDQSKVTGQYQTIIDAAMKIKTQLGL